MISLEAGRLALQRLGRRRVRAGLNVLGILVGVAAAILLIAVGGGVSRAANREVNGLGSSLVVVYPSSTSSSGAQAGFATGSSLTSDDVQALGDPGRVPDAVQAVPSAGLHTRVTALSRSWSTDVLGSSDGFAEARGYELARGAFFNAADLRAATSVAVIGQTVVDNLFAGDDPVGRLIRINQHPFRVVGVFRPRGVSGSYNQDDLVVVPITSAWAYVLPANALRIQQVLLQATNPAVTRAVELEARNVLMNRHRITDPAQADFQIISAQELLERAHRLNAVLSWLLLAIAAIAFVGGATSIANLMLATVTERTREIAVRRAVGARRRDILAQFLAEAVILAGLGGIAGAATGVGLSAALPGLFPDLPKPTVSITSVILALALAMAIGAMAGVYPAMRAAGLQPIDALRQA
jgi:putative ABC transport system permease protein